MHCHVYGILCFVVVLLYVLIVCSQNLSFLFAVHGKLYIRIIKAQGDPTFIIFLKFDRNFDFQISNDEVKALIPYFPPLYTHKF